MTLAIGDPAPDFELQPGPREEKIRLSDYRGEKPVVLLFFPLAFSSVCMDEMCTVAADYARYEDLDAQVLGLSVDSPFVNRKFAAECGAPFPILSDFNRDAARRYDVLYDDYHGLQNVSKRAAFVVDRKGKIAYAWVSEDAGRQPDFERILEAVERAE